MKAIAVAAPQWRISTCRTAAARAALTSGADALHLDFGGAHRGRTLDDPAELAAARAITQDLPIPVLAVNHVNDIGLALGSGRANPVALDVLWRALDCAHRLGAAVVHVPGFRRSLPKSDAVRQGTAEALRMLGDRVSGMDMLLAYESPLSGHDALAVAGDVDDPALRLVLDTGNLLDVGESPEDFADLVQAAGLLLPCLHIKEPQEATARRRGTVFDDLPALLRRTRADSLLVENDYRQQPTLLRADIRRARAAAGCR